MCVCARVDLIRCFFFLLPEWNLAFILFIPSLLFSLVMAKLGKEKPCGFLPSSSEGPTLPGLFCKGLASPINSPYPEFSFKEC